ncbi:hypothetical protein EWO79_23575 [Salmonella enterica]|nr:hypothetical protein [Salmonella enterica]
MSLGSRGCFEYPLLFPQRLVLVGVLLTSNFRLVFRRKKRANFPPYAFLRRRRFCAGGEGEPSSDSRT